MKKLSTVTIIISAYNEANTIAELLSDLMKQTLTSIHLDQVIVVSDGSTDGTVAVVKKIGQIKKLPVVCVSHAERKGKATRLNQTFSALTSDIAVVLDADTRIFDPLFLETLTAPVYHHEADLTSAEVRELSAKNVLQRILQFSMEWKRAMFHRYQQGNNLFTCHGRARAFSQQLYQHIEFQHSINEDAYSYLFALQQGYVYQYVSDTQVWYQLPASLVDHQRQSVRFLHSPRVFDETFGREWVNKAYTLPLLIVVFVSLRYVVKSPVLFMSYVCLFIFTKIVSLIQPTVSTTWTVAATSKQTGTYHAKKAS